MKMRRVRIGKMPNREMDLLVVLRCVEPIKGVGFGNCGSPCESAGGHILTPACFLSPKKDR